MRVYFTNLGCKLNQAEVDKMSRLFVAAGHQLAPRLEDAELHVVNSCTVTHLAARTSRKTARRGHRVAGETGAVMRTVLTGCYATGSPEEAATLAGVDLVVPNEHKEELLERVHAAFPESVPSQGQELDVPYVPLDFGLSRALVKVEDGCNMRCSFCIIPFTRGRQRSRTVDDVVQEVRSLADGGYPEVVVTGVQISEYRDGDRRLYDLVKALLDHTDVPRLRLTSIAPWKFDRRLPGLWQRHGSRLCRHVHMSLQSGCTETLRRMRRPYTADQYAELASELRAAIPGLALTTDVIVGFPRRDRRGVRRQPALRRAAGFRQAPRLHLLGARGNPRRRPARPRPPAGEEGACRRHAGGGGRERAGLRRVAGGGDVDGGLGGAQSAARRFRRALDGADRSLRPGLVGR